MVSKRRQSDPCCSNSSSDEPLKLPSDSKSRCSHIKKAINLSRLRKALKKSGIENEKCVECAKMANGIGFESGDYEYDRTLWLCLSCGTNLCGRLANKHALKHFQTPRSDSHAITMNTTTEEIWCYVCDANVLHVDGELQQCVDLIKSELNKTKSNGIVQNGEANIEINEDAVRTLLDKTINQVHSLSSETSIPGQAKRVLNRIDIDRLPRVRGLSNLGNTCFFNAVLQCLAQTPFLLPALKEKSTPDEEFSLPGGKFKFKDDEEVMLEPISGTLRPWYPLTATLANTLEELQSGGGVLNPRKLFSQLTELLPQFGGGDQHDSHELLRHLLESVKNEDLKRYQKEILKFLNYYTDYRGKDLQSVPNDIKQKAKFYGQQATDRILCPEQVFRGFLVSTLTCQDCHNTSSRHESFLDLSLPVCLEKPMPPRRKSSPEELNLSKEKPKKYIEYRSKKNRTSSQEDSDADIEDNLSEDLNIKGNLLNSKKENGIFDNNGNIESEKLDDDPENLNKDLIETNTYNEFLELAISAKGGKELVQQISQEDNETTLKLADKNETKEKKQKTKRKRLSSYTNWSTTIAPRYQCEEGECSVQSSLNNFTSVELMTGNNKVGCDACSERINGKGGKTIYTNATKQFLISSPPAVLILHLKRFQVGVRYLLRKMTKHVSFPLVLDLASFCASKVRTLPNVHPNQRKLIYSLYGIVEHSGGMHGGHYVAYVKVRPNLAPDDPRWKFLPKGSKVELDQMDEQKARLEDALRIDQLNENRLQSGNSDDSTSSSDSGIESNTSNRREAPPILTAPPEGKWYYVSDSHVMESTEEKVLNAQAYLLFYERIY